MYIVLEDILHAKEVLRSLINDNKIFTYPLECSLMEEKIAKLEDLKGRICKMLDKVCIVYVMYVVYGEL